MLTPPMRSASISCSSLCIVLRVVAEDISLIFSILIEVEVCYVAV
jgi:hypothetical protein